MLNQSEKNTGSGLAEANEPAAELKFKIRALYNELNLQQQKLLRKLFQERFGGNVQTFYNKLKSENLLADEAMFFAGIFDCKVPDLYTEDYPPQLSIRELSRRAKGVRPGKQIGLDVK